MILLVLGCERATIREAASPPRAPPPPAAEADGDFVVGVFGPLGVDLPVAELFLGIDAVPDVD